MKRKWIDAVLIISIVSLIAFYIVPLRPALPLEVVVMVYLGGHARAKRITTIPAFPEVYKYEWLHFTPSCWSKVYACH